MINASSCILGVDIGSVSIHIVLLTLEGKIIYTSTEAHRGEVRQCFSKLIENIHKVHERGCCFVLFPNYN